MFNYIVNLKGDDNDGVVIVVADYVVEDDKAIKFYKSGVITTNGIIEPRILIASFKEYDYFFVEGIKSNE